MLPGDPHLHSDPEPTLSCRPPQQVGVQSTQVPCFSAASLSVSALAQGDSRLRVGGYPSDTHQVGLDMRSGDQQGLVPDDLGEQTVSPRAGPPGFHHAPCRPSHLPSLPGGSGARGLAFHRGTNTPPAGGPVRFLWFGPRSAKLMERLIPFGIWEVRTKRPLVQTSSWGPRLRPPALSADPAPEGICLWARQQGKLLLGFASVNPVRVKGWESW